MADKYHSGGGYGPGRPRPGMMPPVPQTTLMETLRRDHEENARMRRSTMEMRVENALLVPHGTARPSLKGFEKVHSFARSPE